MVYASYVIAYVAKFWNLKWNEHLARIAKLGTHTEFCWKCLPENVHLEDGKGDGNITLYLSFGDRFSMIAAE